MPGNEKQRRRRNSGVSEALRERCGKLLAERIRIRLCKGAYKEPPSIAFERKDDVDANYVRLMKVLNEEWCLSRPRNPTTERSSGKRKPLPFAKTFPAILSSFRCYTAFAAICSSKLVRDGWRFRVYIPFGTEWYPYFMRAPGRAPGKRALHREKSCCDLRPEVPSHSTSGPILGWPAFASHHEVKYPTPPELIDAFSAFVGPEIEDEQIDLTRAALVIARTEYPSSTSKPMPAGSNELGERVGARIADLRPPPHTIAALNHVLFEEAGLRGNCNDYYDPRNSFLNDVLDRGLGIPITLSVVYWKSPAASDSPWLESECPDISCLTLRRRARNSDRLLQPWGYCYRAGLPAPVGRNLLGRTVATS